MKFSNPLACAIGLVMFFLAPASYARSISVDATMTCSSVVPSTETLWIDLAGTGKKGNRAKSGVNFPVLACADSVGTDTNLTSLAYDPAGSVLYTWVDLSVAGGAPSSLTGLANDPTTPALSSFQSDLSVSIVAMVDVLKLTGSYSGDYEILFNYQSFPEVACDNVSKPIAPSFTWFKTTYVFTGAGGVGTCDANSTNDFLFGPNGELLGYNSAADFGSFTLTPGLPPGWIIK